MNSISSPFSRAMDFVFSLILSRMGEGPLLEIKNPDARSLNEVGDSSRIANIRQSPLDNDSIETRQLSKDVI